MSAAPVPCTVGISASTPDGTVTTILNGHRYDIPWREALMLAASLVVIAGRSADRAGVATEVQCAEMGQALAKARQGWER